MSRRELEGVLAHEMSHIRNRDVQVTTLAVTTVGILVAVAEIAARMSWFADWGDDDNGGGALALIAVAALAGVLAFGARILSLAISRHREELADVSAAELVSPDGIRKALEKLEADHTVVHHVSRATAHLWLVTPLRNQGDDRHAKLNRMFDSHPPLDERIAILRKLEGLDPNGRGPVDETITGVPVDLAAPRARRPTGARARAGLTGGLAVNTPDRSRRRRDRRRRADDDPEAGREPARLVPPRRDDVALLERQRVHRLAATWNGTRWVQSRDTEPTPDGARSALRAPHRGDGGHGRRAPKISPIGSNPAACSAARSAGLLDSRYAGMCSASTSFRFSASIASADAVTAVVVVRGDDAQVVVRHVVRVRGLEPGEHLQHVVARDRRR